MPSSQLQNTNGHSSHADNNKMADGTMLKQHYHHQRKVSALQLPSPYDDEGECIEAVEGYCETTFAGKAEQMAKVAELIRAKAFLPDGLVDGEVAWFYGNLGIDDGYFESESAETIANHIMGLYAAKLAAYLKDSDVLDINLEQETDDGALYIHNSRPGISQIDGMNVEERIDNRYLDASCPEKSYRLETYRSLGTVSSSSRTQLRCYFVRKCEFVNINDKDSATSDDIRKTSARTFLEKATPNTLSIYQGVMRQALQRHGPVIELHDVTIRQKGSSKEARRLKRLVIGYRQGTTSGFFTALSHLYHYYGLYSTRKYVENFSNGVTIICLYLTTVATSTNASSNFPPIDHSIVQIVKEASLIYCLPITPLQSLFASSKLSIQEAVYGYAGLVFAQHFLNRLGSEYTALSTLLDVSNNHQHADVMARLKKRLRQETFTREYILDIVRTHPDLVKLLYLHFAAVHYLPHDREKSSSLSFQRLQLDKAPQSDEEVREKIRRTVCNSHEQLVFEALLTFNDAILKTNFFQPTKVALSFRLSPEFLPASEYPQRPYGMFLVIGSEFRGFHVRFMDIARGGIRIIRSRNREAYSINLRSLFDENYALAATQQRKNKDIPEGGSKGTILLDIDKQDRSQSAFEKYTDSILDLLVQGSTPGIKEQIVDRHGQSEILFFGPDEGTADYMDWASQHSRRRGATFWNAFTTGKSPCLGGIPHDVFGMTTRSIHTYVLGILEKCEGGVEAEGKLTKFQTGGPDGDLGSNEIKISKDRTTAIVDGSGVIYDPAGLDRAELLRLAEIRKPVAMFDVKKLGAGGFKVLIEESGVVLPDGERVESGLEFRNSFHLHRLSSADLFVPCGGRPEAVDISNVDSIFIATPGSAGPEKPKWRYIVEGANLFFTQEARLRLEKAGVVIFKDASANKGGVTSSSLEVLAALSMSDDQFAVNMMCPPGRDALSKAPKFYSDYVAAVHQVIERNARQEFECMWKEHQETGRPLAIISDDLSTAITSLRGRLAQAEDLWEDKELRDCVLKRALPSLLLQVVPLSELNERVPRAYLRAVFAAYLASRFVYQHGGAPDQFAFYQFMKGLKCAI